LHIVYIVTVWPALCLHCDILHATVFTLFQYELHIVYIVIVWTAQRWHCDIMNCLCWHCDSMNNTVFTLWQYKRHSVYIVTVWTTQCLHCDRIWTAQCLHCYRIWTAQCLHCDSMNNTLLTLWQYQLHVVNIVTVWTTQCYIVTVWTAQCLLYIVTVSTAQCWHRNSLNNTMFTLWQYERHNVYSGSVWPAVCTVWMKRRKWG
jgi:hypothetical protein